MEKWSNIQGKFSGEKFHMGEGNLGGEFRKKMKTYKFPSKNEYMYEVSSKSENGKMVKFREKIFWGEISQEGMKFRIYAYFATPFCRFFFSSKFLP